MAKATKNIIPQKPVTTYTLELTEEEAGFLIAVMYCIGGDPTKSRRRHAKAILENLETAGVPLTVGADHKVPDIMNSNRSIWFHDEVK